ncbi:MAG TPA: hypothetical protein VFS20_30785 [Longimicrobium sp.]|nr:hypothetical protein [Longimicrobium sp.]
MASNSPTQYSVVFVNNGSDIANACIYQQDPDLANPNVMSLAWLTKAAAPTTRVVMTWQLQYDFVWSETGILAPGVVFNASQALNASPTGLNQATFSKQGGAYLLTSEQQGGKAGSLYIQSDSTIPSKQASVGVGMSGFGTFAVQAEPNKTVTFTPHPEYWITFGTYTQGEVMNIQDLTTQAGQIQFPPNIYSMTATLNDDNSWTIVPTP